MESLTELEIKKILELFELGMIIRLDDIPSNCRGALEIKQLHRKLANIAYPTKINEGAV